ncbi:MAG: ABC transporter substrate-binding protein [Clostridiaceae bacterium]|nr:ABC transporter substrate-binding protein [Clostridiaceae bacterium]
MKKTKLICLILILTLVISVGCSSSSQTTLENTNNSEIEDVEPEADDQRIIIDALGREVYLPEKVETIVALGNTPRFVTYLGLAEQVVGLSGMESDKITPLTAYAHVNQTRWQDVPLVGTDAMGNTEYHAEEIVLLKPDVILCTYPLNVVEDIENKTNLPVVSVSIGNIFLDDYAESLEIIAQVCGVENRATELLEYIDTSLEDLNNRTIGLKDDEQPSVISAAATFKGAHGIEGIRVKDPILLAINANNLAFETLGNEQTETAVEVDREQILLWNPEYIFCDYSGVNLVKQDQATDPEFYNQLTAFQNDQIYQHPSSTSYYSNLEISLANAYYIGSILNPAAFNDIVVEEKIEEIFDIFLGEQNLLNDLIDYGAFYGPIEFE